MTTELATDTKQFSPRELVTHFRIMAHQYFPYLGAYVYSLTPVERDGIGTMAVDKYGRMYYDPAFCTNITLDQGAYVVLHEAWHLILRHCHRIKDILGPTPSASQLRRFNIAADCVVWELMEAIKQHAPPGGVTFDALQAKYPKLKRNLMIGEVYAILAEQDEQEESSLSKQSQNGDNQEQEEGDEDGSNGGGQPGSTPDGKEDRSSRGRKGGQGGEEGGAAGGAPQDGFELIGGSACDGQRRDYEEDPNPNWEAYIEDQLLEDMEQKIEDYERTGGGKQAGSVPGVLKETITAKLRPAPNPWDRLRAATAIAAVNPRGAKDYTYQKVNRRQFAMPNAPRLKGVNAFSPKAVVCVDTSGSMTKKCLDKCLNVIAQGLRAVGDFRVVVGDCQVNNDFRYSSLTQGIDLSGGGGTDMSLLIDYAEKTHHPNVIIVCTDGYTGWPAQPTHAQLIIALTQEVETPGWATTVCIPDLKEDA